MKTTITRYIALITVSLIISGCGNLLEPPPAPENRDPGMGYISFVLEAQEPGRTILPVPTALSGSISSMYFILEFFNPGTTTAPAYDAYPAYAAITGANRIPMAVGTWDLRATAYKDANRTQPVARTDFTRITVNTGANSPFPITLNPIIGSGSGTFTFTLNYPGTVTNGSVTINRLTIIPDEEPIETPEEVIYFSGGTTFTNTSDLDAGYYTVKFYILDNSGKSTEQEEVLHIYQNLTSTATYTYLGNQFVNTARVTSEADDGLEGSLRYAITHALSGTIITIDERVKTIKLNSKLSLSKKITIEGDGVIITRNPEWTTVDTMSPLICVSSGADVTIRRVHFMDGRASGKGSAVCNENGKAVLESCIFSGNQIISDNEYGSAVFAEGIDNSLTVRGCTFYGNSTGYRGGAITIRGGGQLTITGNLFYGNTAGFSNPVVYADHGIVTSGGYNVFDIASNLAGWTMAAGDTSASSLPLSPKSFKPIPTGDAAGALTSLPAGYPAEDFNGKPIAVGGAAGAVQDLTAAGHYLDLTFNSSKGTILVNGAAYNPGADGIFATVNLTTTGLSGGNTLLYWVVNGERIQDNGSQSLTLTDHSVVHAALGQTINVTNESNLRAAVENTTNEDNIIVLGGTITLGSRIVINRNLTLRGADGTGAVLTRTAAGTAISQLLQITGGDVFISGIHFRGGRATGGAAAILNEGGNVVIESCIFSGNQRTGAAGAGGGAISNTSGSMIIRGCTFYNNSTSQTGGAIYSTGALTLLGNMFYGNTASSNFPVLHHNGGSMTSKGYNVVDVNLGVLSNQSGWTGSTTGDQTFGGLAVSTAVPPFNTTSFVPVTGPLLNKFIPYPAPAGFPAKDFNGANRTFPGTPGAVTQP